MSRSRASTLSQSILASDSVAEVDEAALIDRPVEKFIAAPSSDDLLMSDVSVLLADYKRLAQALEDRKAFR